MHDTEETKEKAILIALEPTQSSADENLNELALLVETGGGITVGRLTQKRENAHPGHYFGTGKMEELRDLVSLLEADAVVCDDELTNAQQRNLDKQLGVKILDRTQVILDIFARRATTAEGKAQVETAQLKYRLSHLTGLGPQLSRLGGGIGTRGPGEKKLETDRRHIRARITQLRQELDEIEMQRNLMRQRRKKSGLPIAALVGYTNAGKSTLMKTLTGADVFIEDKVFATLDTTTRKTELPGGGAILFTDTVGFIQKLPHHLIQAFRATLDELRYADILVHVIDSAGPRPTEQAETVYRTLRDLGCMDKPIVSVYNKSDLQGSAALADAHALKSLSLSAQTGDNCDALLLLLEEILQQTRKKTAILIPYEQGRLVQSVHERCEIITEEHRENGTYILAYLDDELKGKLRRYVIN